MYPWCPPRRCSRPSCAASWRGSLGTWRCRWWRGPPPASGPAPPPRWGSRPRASAAARAPPPPQQPVSSWNNMFISTFVDRHPELVLSKCWKASWNVVTFLIFYHVYCLIKIRISISIISWLYSYFYLDVMYLKYSPPAHNECWPCCCAVPWQLICEA